MWELVGGEDGRDRAEVTKEKPGGVDVLLTTPDLEPC